MTCVIGIIIVGASTWADSPAITMPKCSNHSDLTRFPAPTGGGCDGVVRSVADWEARRSDIIVGAKAVMGGEDPRHAPPGSPIPHSAPEAPSYGRIAHAC